MEGRLRKLDRRRASLPVLVVGVVLLVGTVTAAAQRSVRAKPDTPPPCPIKDLEPGIVRCDASLLYRKVSDGVRFSTEWSKIEKIRDALRDYSLKNSKGCYYPSLDDLNLNLYVGEPVMDDRLGSTTPLRLFGSRVQKKPGSADEELIRVAYPPDGTATLGQVFEDRGAELRIFLDDLMQVELVFVPRLEPAPSRAGTQSCFRTYSLTLVPSRVFDEELPWSKQETPDSPARLPSKISLRARRESLERLAGQVNWIQRMGMERAECKVEAGEDGYSELQVQSLYVTLKRALPGREFLQDCHVFWSEVKDRIEQLRQWDSEKRQELFKKGQDD